MIDKLDVKRILIFLAFAFGIAWVGGLVLYLTGGLAESPYTAGYFAHHLYGRAIDCASAHADDHARRLARYVRGLQTAQGVALLAHRLVRARPVEHCGIGRLLRALSRSTTTRNLA